MAYSVQRMPSVPGLRRGPVSHRSCHCCHCCHAYCRRRAAASSSSRASPRLFLSPSLPLPRHAESCSRRRRRRGRSCWTSRGLATSTWREGTTTGRAGPTTGSCSWLRGSTSSTATRAGAARSPTSPATAPPSSSSSKGRWTPPLRFWTASPNFPFNTRPTSTSTSTCTTAWEGTDRTENDRSCPLPEHPPSPQTERQKYGRAPRERQSNESKPGMRHRPVAPRQQGEQTHWRRGQRRCSRDFGSLGCLNRTSLPAAECCRRRRLSFLLALVTEEAAAVRSCRAS
jgi:hypothetical protein